MIDLPALRRLHERVRAYETSQTIAQSIASDDELNYVDPIKEYMVAALNALPALLARVEAGERLARAARALHMSTKDAAVGTISFDVRADDTAFVDLPDALKAWDLAGEAT